MKSLDFLPIRKLYRNAIGNWTSYNYIDVVPTTATFINADYHPNSDSTCTVPFQATDPVPAFDTVPASFSHIFSLVQAKVETPISIAIADYITKLEQIIEQYWDPTLFHVHYHSSGWDSRIISTILRKLYLKNGMDWLGEILFVCAKWEGAEFREIMRRQGWNKDWYTVYNENVPENEYFVSAFNFITAWQQLGAPMTFPVNQWWFIIDDLQKAGRLPDSKYIQVVTGLWANETIWCLLRGGKNLEDNFKRYYCHVMASFCVKATDIFIPFTHRTLLEALPTYGLNKYAGINSADFRRALANYVCPELSDIRNVSKKDPGHPISQRLFDKVKAEYNNSRFAKLRPHATDGAGQITDFSEWWANWSLASLWEHLANTGYKFVVKL